MIKVKQKGFVDMLFVLFAFAVAALALTAEGINHNQSTTEKIDSKCVDGTYDYPKDIRDDPCIMGE